MYWRLRRKDYEANKGEGNRRRLKRLVTSGPPPGVLAYAGGKPVGWCAVAPREDYPVLGNSRILSPVDDQPVWSVTCLFVARGHRRSGLSSKLVQAATDFARAHGARLVEGYPVEPKKGAMPDAFVWTGLAGSFEKAGFKEVARRSPTRPIMRKKLR